MIGYKLTEAEAAELSGQYLNDTTTFNPKEDINGDKYIFEGEVSECVNEKFMWVKNLIPSEYVPPINNNTP